MPVGTKATVKTLTPGRAARRSARRSCSATPTTCTSGPGDELIAELGGLHRFMGWDGPILTDSGGFQVFSLRDTLARGRRRRRHVPQRLRRRARRASRPSSPPRSSGTSAATSRCASTRCRRPASPRAELEDAVRRTTEWAAPPARTPTARRGPAPLRDHPGRHRPRAPAPLDRGARRARLRRQRDRRPRDRRGPRRDVRDDRLARRRCCPADKPRYFMGIGDPEGILEVIEAGVDMFDCVLPTRTARTGSALTWEGRLNLRNARYARDPRAARRELRLPGLHAASRAPTSATSSTRTSCSACACSRSTIYASSSS